jgi:hypothetical protein
MHGVLVPFRIGGWRLRLPLRLPWRAMGEGGSGRLGDAAATLACPSRLTGASEGHCRLIYSSGERLPEARPADPPPGRAATQLQLRPAGTGPGARRHRRQSCSADQSALACPHGGQFRCPGFDRQQGKGFQHGGDGDPRGSRSRCMHYGRRTITGSVIPVVLRILRAEKLTEPDADRGCPQRSPPSTAPHPIARSASALIPSYPRSPGPPRVLPRSGSLPAADRAVAAISFLKQRLVHKELRRH